MQGTTLLEMLMEETNLSQDNPYAYRKGIIEESWAYEDKHLLDNVLFEVFDFSDLVGSFSFRNFIIACLLKNFKIYSVENECKFYLKSLKETCCKKTTYIFYMKVKMI